VKTTVRVQSLDRAFDILTLLGDEPNGTSLSEISERLDLPKSTVHRLLGVLSQRMFVRKSQRSGTYRLGPGIIELCSNYLNNLELKTETTPHMDELSATTGNVVFLAIRQNDQMVYIDSKEQITSLRKYAIIGQRKPLYCTSLGKALLMGLEEEDIRGLLADTVFEKRGPNTHTNIESLLADIRECKRRGWSLDDQEAEPDINCVAAPIYDYRGQVIAAVSTSWILEQQPQMTPEKMAPIVMKCTRAISYNMGWNGTHTR
jgi:DNA-binding IclR family transcriptional regulator